MSSLISQTADSISTPVFVRLPGRGATEELMHFGDDQWHAQPIAQEPLTAPVAEHWLVPGPVHHTSIGRFRVARSPDYLFACAEVPVQSQDMRAQTLQVYRELMALIHGSKHQQLLRFWNFVPNINQGADDNEVYRQFCWGRAEAMPLADGALPAATAIGSADDTLRISVLSASPRIEVEHLENPRQVSAYRYPRQYGPRSPSFARATRVSFQGDAMLLLSGTASIVSHETKHPEDLSEQTAETHRNIQSLMQVAANGGLCEPEVIRLYLRRPEQLSLALQAYQRAFDMFPEPAVVQGDICRSALLMEIDGAFRVRKNP